MAMSAPKGDSSEPMVEMNTTPLIDVMLVLLIMFIITLPPPTHAVKIDLPQDCAPNCPPPPPVLPTKNVLYVSPGGVVTWNQAPVSWGQLDQLLVDSQDPASRTQWRHMTRWIAFSPRRSAPRCRRWAL